MPISKDQRKISVLRKGIVCLASDKISLNDRENVAPCNSLYRHTLKGTKEKVRSVSVNNPHKVACIETRSIIDHRRFSYSDALVKYKNNFQVRNRSLILKSNNDVQRNTRPSKTKCKSTSSKSTNDFNWVAIPYDEKRGGKLIAVYGKTNVGRKSLLHLLQSPDDLKGKGLQYGSILSTNSDSQRCFTFKRKDTLYETMSSEDEEADACIVMFAVSDKASFQFAKLCVQHIRKNHRDNIPIFLVANKSDMIRYRKVSSNEAIRVADIHNCQYFETSLTMKYNVDMLFREILEQVDDSVAETSSKCFQDLVSAVRRRIQRAFNR